MNTILSSLLLTLFFTLSGCGGTTTNSESLDANVTETNQSTTTSIETNSTSTTPEESENSSPEANATTDTPQNSVTAPTVKVDDLEFSSSVNKIIIHSALEEHPIEFSIVDNAGFPVTGKTVYVKFFTQGSIDHYELQSDSRGVVKFVYKSPENIENLPNVILLFSLEKSLKKQLAVEVEFAQVTPVIALQNSVITITENEQIEEITLLSFRDNKLFNGSPIFVKYPTIDGNYQGGSFKEQSVEVVDGKALFHFIGPKKLENIQDTIFSFYQESNTTKEVNLTVKYRPNKEDITLQVIKTLEHSGNIVVTQPEEEVTLTLSVKGISDLFIKNGTINVQGFNPQFGEFTNISAEVSEGRATFHYKAPSDISGLGSNDFIFKDSSSDVNVTWKITFAPPALKTLKLEKSAIKMIDSAQKTEVNILVYDTNDSPMNNQVVSLDSSYLIDTTKGYFENSTVKSVDGIATFIFKGPVELNAQSDQTFTFISGGESTSLTVSYNPVQVAQEENRTVLDYTFTASSSELNISYANERKYLEFYIVDSAGYPVANRSVFANFFTKGSLNSNTLTSDSSGKVRFEYRAADSINNSDDFAITFSLEKESSKQIVVAINFNQKTPTLTLQNSTITLTKDAQIAEISLLVFDNSELFEGGYVAVKYPIVNGSYVGATLKESRVAVVNGKATFTLEGPSKLERFDETIFTFYPESDSSKEVSLSVKYEPISDTTQFIQSISAERNITITHSMQKEIIILHVYDNLGALVRSGTINVQAFDPKYGMFTGIDVDPENNLETAVTSAIIRDGVAHFNYKAPLNLGDVNNSSVNFTFIDSASEVQTQVKINFADVKEDGTTIVVDDDNITIDASNRVFDLNLGKYIYTQKIALSIFDSNNYPIESGSIVVHYPENALNAQAGYFENSELEFVNGRVAFEYKLTAELVKKDEPYIFTFYYKKDGEIVSDSYKEVAIYHTPKVAILSLEQSEINATINSQTYEIQAKIVDEENRTYSEGSVQVLLPEEAKSGTDVGYMATSSVNVDADGVAKFIYTLPSDMQRLKDANISSLRYGFYHSSSPDNLQYLTILINPVEGQYVEKQYNIVTLFSDGNSSMELESAKNITLFIEDEYGNVISDKNTTIKLSLLDSALATIHNDANRTDENNISLLFDENMVAFRIQSKKSIGTLPLKIDVQFLDSEHQEKNITKVLNLTIFTTEIVPKILRLQEPTISVNRNSQEFNVTILAFDSNNKPLNGKTITVSNYDIDTSLGYFTRSSADVVDGQAKFTFVGPYNLQDALTVEEKKFEFRLGDLNESLVVKYIASNNTSKSVNSITLRDANLTLTQTGEHYNIVLDVINADNSLADGVTIDVQGFNPKYGTFAQTTATVSNGVALFEYIAPDSFNTIYATNNNFTFIESISGKNVKFKVTYPAQPVITTLKIERPTISLTEDAQEVKVRVLAYDENDKAISGQDVNITNYEIDVSKGYFTRSSATLIEGVAEFTFKGPNPLITKSSIQVTFQALGVNNIIIDDNLTIEYKPIVDTTKSIDSIVTDGNITIAQANEVKSVVLDIRDSSGGLIRNGVVNVQGFNPKYGAFTRNSIEVLDGVAVFEYKAPSDLTSLTSHNFLFIDSASDVNISWKVTFTPTPTADLNVRLSVSDSNITLGKDSEIVSIIVSAFDENNYSIEDGSVIVQYPASFINENLGGSFTLNEVNISQGRAEFVFNGPSTLERSDATYEFRFFYKKSGQVTDINKSVGIKYEPQTATVVLSVSEINATTNSQTFSIDAKVFNKDNTPYEDGSVNVVYPDEVLQGIDVGVMSDFKKEIVNGVATFTYTAPRNLKDVNVSTLAFKFYHSSNTNTDKTLTVAINPSDNQVVTTTYQLGMNISDNSVSMGLQSAKILTFTLRDEDGTLLNDSNITELNITVLNSALGLLSNVVYTDEKNITDDNNSVSVTLRSKTVSGVIPIKVDVNFKGLNNEEINISKVFNIVVLSGPPTAISITYASTTQDSDYAKFEEHLVVSVVDKYFNPVNTSPAISVGAIIGYAKDGDTGVGNDYVYVEPDEAKAATLDPTVAESLTLTSGAANTFANLDENNDVLAIFGKGYTYNASGKWDFTPNANNKVNLVDQYDGNSSVTVTNLGYAAGNNQREDVCNPGTSYVGNIVVDADEPVLDSLGRAKLKLSYDYFLTSKDVVVWINLVGYQASIDKVTKVGSAKKITLRGHGLEGTNYISYGSGATGTITVRAKIKDTDEFLHNSNFTLNVSTRGGATLRSVYDSRDNIYSCDDDGIAEVQYDFNNSDSNSSDGTITLTIGEAVSSEF